MAKVKDTTEGWVIRCRMCRSHTIPKDGRWKFNEDLNSPTFTPSINESVNQPEMKGYRPEAKSSRCHFVITNGRINYCGDCSHVLSGRSEPLEDFE